MPTVVHRHFSPTGDLVGYTEIQAESAWDDEQRANAEAAIEARELICSQCGNPREICSNPECVVYPQRSTCYVTAGREQNQRKFDARAAGKSEAEIEAAGQPKAYVVGVGEDSTAVLIDGTHVWASLSDLTPDDPFV